MDIVFLLRGDKMEIQNLCAECLNLGRAVYCMQCVRINKGHKDMFIPNSTVSALPCLKDKQSGNSNADIAAKKVR